MATMSARYTVIDGEVIAQERGGVRHQLVPDPVGSTVALYDDSGTKTDTFEYWPYGESASRTGSTTVKFQYVGSYGYYQDSGARNYVRARYFDASHGRWISFNVTRSFGIETQGYIYAENSPILLSQAYLGGNAPCKDLLKAKPDTPKPIDLAKCVQDCYKFPGKQFIPCLAKCSAKLVGGGLIKDNIKAYTCCLGNSKQKDRNGNPLQPCGAPPNSYEKDGAACCTYYFCVCVLKENTNPFFDKFERFANALCPGKIWNKCATDAQQSCGAGDSVWTPGDK